MSLFVIVTCFVFVSLPTASFQHWHSWETFNPINFLKHWRSAFVCRTRCILWQKLLDAALSAGACVILISLWWQDLLMLLSVKVKTCIQANWKSHSLSLCQYKQLRRQCLVITVPMSHGSYCQENCMSRVFPGGFNVDPLLQMFYLLIRSQKVGNLILKKKDQN